MTLPIAKYTEDFEEDFQLKIAACIYRDSNFNRRSFGLIKPDYFDNVATASIVSCCLGYFKKYSKVPTKEVLFKLIADAIKSKAIRVDLRNDIVTTFKAILEEDISDVDFIVDKIAEFARHKAMEAAALQYVDLIEKGLYDKAAKIISDASAVSANESQQAYDFFGKDELKDRERRRNERLSGIYISGDVISTGIRALDKNLYHKGWAKKEFYVMMGPAKSGKSISLAFFAKNATLQGKNVLFITLEVSKDITADRIDSSITGVAMAQLECHIIDVKDKIEMLKSSSGKLVIEEFPPSFLTQNKLNRVIEKHKYNGTVFDMIVVDYADIMMANELSQDPIQNSRSIYLALSAMAKTENVIVLSAMQTNREGMKAAVAKMEHAADDINRVRIPDLVISINRTDDERSRNEARLFFAASRNQAGEISLLVEQDLECMNFIKKVIRVE